MNGKRANSSPHDEAMRRLCFVCAELISDEKYRCYDVIEHKSLISRVLKSPPVFSLPGWAPDHFCHKCMSKLKHIDEGTTLTSSLKMLEWGECGPNCSSCAKITKRTQGRGRKKKVSIVIICFSLCFFSYEKYSKNMRNSRAQLGNSLRNF